MQVLEVTAPRGLKIRLLPDINSDTLVAMPNGMLVTRIDDILWNGNWFKIRADFSDRYRVEGYSHRNHLDIYTASSTPQQLIQKSIRDQYHKHDLHVVIASSLRLRDTPINGRVISNLPRDTVVRRLEDSSDLAWWKVSTKIGSMETEGFVAHKYLAPIAPPPAPGADLSRLPNIRDTINRLFRFIGDYAAPLDETVLKALNDVVTDYGINKTSLRFSHFMAQLAHESSNFTLIEENLRYSAERLLEIFPSYFSSHEEAKAFEYKEQRIANRVYANRMDNGDETSQDGWRYRGRGYIQLTGRYNYRTIGKRIGQPLEDKPDLVSTKPVIALHVAADYWDSRNLNDAADSDDIEAVTYGVNGGHHGLDQRKLLLARAKSIWGG